MLLSPALPRILFAQAIFPTYQRAVNKVIWGHIYIYIYNNSWIFVYESLRQIKVAIDQKAFESNRSDSLAWLLLVQTP